MSLLNRLVQNPLGAIGVLAIAAFLEALGDSFFQASFYRSSGISRVLALLAGTVVLALYGSTVNLPRWDFGKLIGVYVVLFFVAAQIVAKVRFDQSPTLPIYVGGSLIALGGLVTVFWKALTGLLCEQDRASNAIHFCPSERIENRGVEKSYCCNCVGVCCIPVRRAAH